MGARAGARPRAPYAEAPAIGRIALVGESEHDVREVMIEGPAGLLRTSPRSRAAGVDLVARPAGMAPTARWRKRSRPTTRKACAGRNSTPPGATNSPSGAMRRRPSTCCSSGCGWGAPAPAHHHHAAADPAVEAADRRSAHRGDARRHAGQRRASVARLPRRGAGALCRHAARPPGDRRRDHRGPARRAVDARHDRSGARRVCAAAARIVVGIDPPASSRPGADACGIVAAGRAEDGCIYVLEDATVAGLPPAGWATRGDRALPAAQGRRAGRGSQPGRRHGRRRAAQRRCLGAAQDGARHARQISARRAGGGALRARPRQARRAAEGGAGGSDVRLRPRRPVVGRLAGPARRAGLGGDGVDGAGVAGAEDQVASLARLPRAPPTCR